MLKFLITLVIFLKIPVSDSARILAVFPLASISHHYVFRPFIKELVNKGHEVVVITTDPEFQKGEAPSNLKEVDIHNVSYTLWREHTTEMLENIAYDLKKQIGYGAKFMLKLFDEQFASKEIQEVIREGKHFDLIIAEAYFKMHLVFSYIFKAPIITISSMSSYYGDYPRYGGSIHPILYPTILNRKLNKHSLYDQLCEIYNDVSYYTFFNNHQKYENDYIAKNVPGSPLISELHENVELLFVNEYPVWEGIRPKPATIIQTGRCIQEPDTQIPTEIKSFLDSSSNGVIYFSLGTNVKPSILPQSLIQIITEVLSEMPYNVLMKWDSNVLPGKQNNTMLFKWLPQFSILKHPNIRVFITQGGLQSTEEAINAGVPLIGLPFIFDQEFNTEKYLVHGIGLKLDVKTLNKETFKNAINTVIGNKSYRDNVVKLRSLIKDQHQKPLDQAVWWTEYILRYGQARHLRSPGTSISEYLELELLIIVTACVVILLSIFTVLVRFLLIKIVNLFRKKTKKCVLYAY